MFGILRPCQHRLSASLHADWVAHLCGLCLTLRGQHGQLARAATNYDGLVISALVEAQAAGDGARRSAGPCPMRGMRRATVAEGQGSVLAASVSLVLASAKLRDHIDDRDGAMRHRTLATMARSTADRWAAQGGSTATLVGFDTGVLTGAVEGQLSIERGLELGDSVLQATEPTELATAAAFAHTAVLASQPSNVEPLREVGTLFGRVAHLLDAVEDREEDALAGAWNPLTATGTSFAEARRLCGDAVRGIRLALREAELKRPALVHALLVHELEHAVTRTFGHAAQPPHSPTGPRHEPGLQPPAQEAGQLAGRAGQEPGAAQPPHDHGGPPDTPTPPPRRGGTGIDGEGGCCWVPKFRVPAKKRGAVFGCVVASYMCCTCQFCCRDPYPGPWSGKPHSASCDCGCDCCDCDC